MRVHFALALSLCAGLASAQTMMPIPAFSRTYSSSAGTRGFFFQAPMTFLITGLRVPDESSAGVQNVEVYVMQSQPPAFPATGNTGQVFYAAGVPSSQIIATSILVQNGEWVGVLGACGSATMANSYAANGPFTSDVLGSPVVIDRFLTQSNLATSGGNQPYSTEPGYNISRVEVYVAPAQGLYTNFSATPTSGASPLAVQFSDQTLTSDPGGILSWAWDFESDGVVDSTIQNPPHTYNTCGYFDVTLTTTDSQHPPSTMFKQTFITVDPQLLVTADFSAAPRVVTAPGVVNFTDTSVGSPTTWAWDLDGDTVVDSTVQNPSFTYNVAGRYDVTLTAGNACGGHSVTKTEFVVVVGATSNTHSPELLEFQFNETRGTQVANTASTTIAPESATIDIPTWQGDPGRRGFMGNEPGFGCMGATAGRIDTGYAIDISGSHTVMFWHRVQSVPTYSYAFGGGTGSARCYYAGTYWSLRSWGNLSGFIDSSTDPGSLAGWNHWAVVVDDATGTGQWYLNGVADGAPLSFAPGSFVFQNAGNFIIGTYSSSTRYSTYVDADDFRVYSRALTATEIQAGLLHENATTSRYAGGCAGISGVPRIGANGAPTIGNAGFALTLENAELARGGLLVLGAQAHTWLSVVPLPYSLDFLYGAGSGCGLQTGLDVLVPINTGGGSMSLPFPIPAGYAGSHGYAQFLILGTQGAVTAGLDINIEHP